MIQILHTLYLILDTVFSWFSTPYMIGYKHDCEPTQEHQSGLILTPLFLLFRGYPHYYILPLFKGDIIMWMRSGNVYFCIRPITRNGIFRSAERRIGLSFLHLRKSTYGLVLENKIAWLHTEKCLHVLVVNSCNLFKKLFLFFAWKTEKIPRLFFCVESVFLLEEERQRELWLKN